MISSTRETRQQLSPEQRERLRQKRRESRASSTYKEFLADLHGRGFSSDEQAERAATAVLCALEQRLTQDNYWKFESQLPSKLKDLLVRCERHDDLRPRDIGRAEFLDLVASDLGGDVDTVSVVRAVFDTVADHVTAGEVQKVVGQLPAELKDLWPEWAHVAEENRRAARVRQASNIAVSEPTPEIVDHVLELPVRAQLGILRTIAPRILSQLDEGEREGFIRDLNEEVSQALSGQPTYDLRNQGRD